MDRWLICCIACTHQQSPSCLGQALMGQFRRRTEIEAVEPSVAPPRGTPVVSTSLVARMRLMGSKMALLVPKRERGCPLQPGKPGRGVNSYLHHILVLLIDQYLSLDSASGERGSFHRLAFCLKDGVRDHY